MGRLLRSLYLARLTWMDEWREDPPDLTEAEWRYLRARDPIHSPLCDCRECQ